MSEDAPAGAAASPPAAAAAPHLATSKAIVLGTMVPLVSVALVGKITRFKALSLDLEAWRMVAWVLMDVIAWAGIIACVIGTIEMLRSRRRVQTVVFILYAALAMALAGLEAGSMNFAWVTGSMLDATMLFYAAVNLNDTWDLISGSTPVWLKAMMVVVLVTTVALLGSLRRKLEPWRGLYERRHLLVGVGFLLALSPWALAPLLTPPRLESTTALPGSYAALKELLPRPRDFGTAGDLDYDTSKAKLVPKPGQQRRNVVVIMLESTRASATTPYNPELKTTPYLATLAERSLMAERAYTITPHTSKALISVGCGVDPYLGVDIKEASKVGMPQRCMAKLFDRAGYATAFFQSAVKHFEGRPQLVKNMGFESFYPLERFDLKGFAKVNYFGREDDIMLAPSMSWIAEQSEPFFLTYLTLTPHHDYRAPTRYGRHDFDEDDEFNRYLNAVHYVDHFVKNVIEGLKEQGVYEDTVIVVVGDHGEGFGEHGRYQHDRVIHEEGLTVPLLFHDPKRPVARRISAPVSQLDIAPTLIEMSGHEIVNGDLPGLNLLGQTPPEDRVLHAYCWANNLCAARIMGDQKLIHFFNRRADMFYDLANDPKEQKSLPARVKQSDIDALLDWYASTNEAYEAHDKAYRKEFVSTSRQRPEHALSARFNEAIELYGYDIESERLPGGEQQLTVTLYLHALKDIEPGWKMFMHGFDSKGGMRNLDHVPVAGTLPVDQFKAGTFIKDRHSFSPREKDAQGDYEIAIGFWHEKHGRMAITPADERVKEGRFKVTNAAIE